MNASNDRSLAHLVAQAVQRRLLEDHRFVEGFLYLDLGDRRFVFDDQMGRTFLMGLLAGYERSHGVATPARAA